MSNLVTMRTTLEQLRIEKKLKREKTSKTIDDLKKFILSQQESDKLVTGFGNNSNPYKNKGFSCELI